MRPSIAAAAAVAAPARCVRAPGPWRPTKLRLLVETHRSPAGDDLVVEREAHRASRLAPLKAGCGEDAVEPERLGLSPHAVRARHHPRAHALRHAPAANYPCCCLQVRQPAVRAGADEHVLDRKPEQLLAGAQAHVLERLAAGEASRRDPAPVRDRGSWRRGPSCAPGWCPT